MDSPCRQNFEKYLPKQWRNDLLEQRMKDSPKKFLKMAVVWGCCTCVSEVLTGSIIRAIITLMMKTVCPSETSVNFYQTTRRNVPGDSHLCTRRRENLISHLRNSYLTSEVEMGQQAVTLLWRLVTKKIKVTGTIRKVNADTNLLHRPEANLPPPLLKQKPS
jgi:hypothetical protein